MKGHIRLDRELLAFAPIAAYFLIDGIVTKNQNRVIAGSMVVVFMLTSVRGGAASARWAKLVLGSAVVAGFAYLNNLRPEIAIPLCTIAALCGWIWHFWEAESKADVLVGGKDDD